MDDAGLSVGVELPQHRPHGHADLDLLQVHIDELALDHDPVVGLDHGDGVGLQHVVAVRGLVDDRERVHGSGPRQRVGLDLADGGPPAVGAEGPRREEDPPAVGALRSHEIVPAGDLPPLPCDG